MESSSTSKPAQRNSLSSRLKIILGLVLVAVIGMIGVCIAGGLYLFAPNIFDLLAPAPPMLQAVMVNVPAGEFAMGTDDEFSKTAHPVYLDAFSIDQSPVTNAQYKQCVDAGKCAAPKKSDAFMIAWYYGVPKYNNYPVVNVTWFDAQKYCEWAGKHLPTEAQWEKTARGTDGRLYPWGNTAPQNKTTGPLAVGSYPAGASPYGARDLVGNVYEWVADWYGEYPSILQRNPTGSATGTERVRRGAIASMEGILTATTRIPVEPTDSDNKTGFRCAQ